MVPLQNMDFVLEELQRIAKLGCFAAVFIRPAFVEGRYLNNPYYIGPDGDPKAPYASPLYADLRGLPPVLILVGTSEVLLDDSTRFAERAVENFVGGHRLHRRFGVSGVELCDDHHTLPPLLFIAPARMLGPLPHSLAS